MLARVITAADFIISRGWVKSGKAVHERPDSSNRRQYEERVACVGWAL